MSDNLSVLSSPQTEAKLGATLKENPNLLALFIKPIKGESLSVFRPESVKKNEIEALSATAISSLGEKNFPSDSRKSRFERRDSFSDCFPGHN